MALSVVYPECTVGAVPLAESRDDVVSLKYSCPNACSSDECG